MRRIAFPALLILLAACVTNPYTGREQLILLDRDTEMKMGVQAYQEMLSKVPLTYDPAYWDVVQRVTHRLSVVMEQGWEDVQPPRFEWEVRVINKPKVMNAWCLPGGKMAVYTGIFPAAYDEDGLAIIMGHEIMHAVLRHGNERVSQGMLAEIGVTVLTEALGGDDPEKKKEMYALLGLGVQIGIMLPFSRDHETEADEYGLYLAAKAGYDPRAGIEVWKRMDELSGGGLSIEFLSTHPSHATRIENMRRWMPKAMEYYRASRQQSAHVLPPPSGAGAGTPPAATAAPGIVRYESRHSTIKGRPGAEFEFEFLRAAYIEDILAEGPGGLSTVIEVKSPLHARARRAVTLWRLNASDPPMPDGMWRFTFRGSIAGRNYSEVAEFSLH